MKLTRRVFNKALTAMGLAGVFPSAPHAELRTAYGFPVSMQQGCKRHGNLGDVGPSVTGYQQDHECFSGIWMDADVYFEGYEPDLIYKPCQCHPKHCRDCRGAGDVIEVHEGEEFDGECMTCGGTGWIGEPEHPDERYVGLKV